MSDSKANKDSMTKASDGADECVYTEALMRAGGVARTGITRWVRLGLLPQPEPEMRQDPMWHSRYVMNRYPAWAVERARFIGEMRRRGHRLEEIAAMIRDLPEDGATPAPGPNAPAPAPAGVSASEVLEVADVAPITLSVWVRRGLMPAPTRVSQGFPVGFYNRFPLEALDRARFIRKMRDQGLPLDRIAELIRLKEKEELAAAARPADDLAAAARPADEKDEP